MNPTLPGSSLRLLRAIGFPLVLIGSLLAETPRHIADDDAYENTVMEKAAKLHQEGKLIPMEKLVERPPSKEPIHLPPPATGPAPSPVDLYDRIRSSTVSVGLFYRCHDCDHWHLNDGTGFVVAEGGIVSSCTHVLQPDPDEIKEAFPIAADADGNVYPIVAILAADDDSDTCLVRLVGAKLRPLPLRAGARTGENVFCVGHPNGFRFMFTQGMVARVSRWDMSLRDHATRKALTLQLTCEYSPGSSGGPITDANGNVVAQANLVFFDRHAPDDDPSRYMVTARTATAAEEILRLADPANCSSGIPVKKPNPAEALNTLKNTVDAMNSDDDSTDIDALLENVKKAVNSAQPEMMEPAQRREFALLAVEALFSDVDSKEWKKILPLLEKIPADKESTAEQRMKAGNLVLSYQADEVDNAPQFAAWEKQFLAHLAAFPNNEGIADLKALWLELAESHAADRIEAVAAQLANDGDEEVAGLAKEAIARAKARSELRRAPLELKFTALDGSDVDVAKLRGKVVLIDFWATWCGPCMREMPNVVKIHREFHGKGLEIIGISLDEKKSALTQVIKKQNIPWPQYFDGKGWDNPIVKNYGIDGIPAMWLVNKQGMVIDFDAMDGLEEKIAKLLAE